MKLWMIFVMLLGLFIGGGTAILTAQDEDQIIFNDTEPTLINGRPANPGEFPEVVYISMGGSRCSATVIGERVILTAAHCGSTGSTATFQIGQTQYSARLERAPNYPSQDHDISLGLVSKPITEVKPVNVGGSYAVGKIITLAGYGCINPGGGGGNDGILRVGETKITGQQSYDMVSSMPNGAALCFGDSGGPAFEIISSKHYVLGVNSKGNIRDTNYNTRTDLTASKQFFQAWAKKNSVDVCGITKDCFGGVNPTPTPQPSPTPGPGCKSEYVALGQCLRFL